MGRPWPVCSKPRIPLLKEARNITAMPGTHPPSSPSQSCPQDEDKPEILTLFEEEETPLLKYAYSLTGRRAIAEELVQEVFLQLHHHWDTVDNPRAWLFRSVRNRAFNHHRDNRKELLSEDDPTTTQPNHQHEQTPELELQRMEATGFLRLLLAELDEADRRIIELKYYDGLKYQEISDQLSISVSNVGYRLHHILKELAVKLQKIGIDSSTPPSSQSH